MIKVCYIIGQLTIGGAERQLYELAKRLNRNYFEPMVISLSSGGFWSEKIKQEGIEVIELQRKRHIEITRLLKLIRTLKIKKPHIVHTYLFPANSYGRIAAIFDRIPVIIASERSLMQTGKDKTIYQLCVDKLLSCFSQGIICNSYKASETLIKKYLFSPKKVFVVHNGIDLTNFLKKDNYNDKNKTMEKVIGTIGRLVPTKNHKLFLEMAKNLLSKSENENLKFIVVGAGSLEIELKRYSQSLGLGDKIIFAGERNDIPELLRKMDIFVTTSSCEGMSNAIMEAMAAGLPVIATDIGGNRELIVNKETGFLCPPDNVMAFSDRTSELINNEYRAMQMGKKGRERLLNKFKVEKMVEKTESIYIKGLKQKNIV